jgi:hypothetical protein
MRLLSRRNCVLLGIASTLQACATPYLYSEDRKQSYKEKISSLLLSQDGKKMVVMTPKYHYIFDATPEISSVLENPLHEFISAEIYELHVKKDNSVHIDIRLLLARNASTQAYEKAKSINFKPNDIGNDLNKTIQLQGIRYVANPELKLPEYLKQTLNREYDITVMVEPGIREQAMRTLVTPLALTVDGILVLGSLPLVVFYMFALKARPMKFF